MPVIKSAKKKLRKDRKRELQNNNVRKKLKDAIKKARATKKSTDIIYAVKTADKAAKGNIIHANKASRIKSSLAKLAAIAKLKPQQKKPTSAKVAKQ